MGPFVRLVAGHWQLILITALIYALWDTDFVQPIRVLIVFLHELSHLVATILTGGSVEDLMVNSAEAGHVYSRGGNRFAILSAGYLGSLLFGVLLLVIALRTHADRAVTGGLGGLMLIVAVLYTHTAYSIIFISLTGAALITSAIFMPLMFNDLVLRVIGLVSMIYVPFDILADTIRGSRFRSDARMLAEEYGGATMLWGALWLIVSVAVIALTLRYGLGRNSNIRLRGATKDTPRDAHNT